MICRFTVIEGLEPGTSFNLRMEEGPVYTVGRCADADININHLLIPRAVCCLFIRDSQITIQHLGSRNGFWVNSQLLDAGEKSVLQDGDEVRIARVRLRFTSTP